MQLFSIAIHSPCIAKNQPFLMNPMDESFQRWVWVTCLAKRCQHMDPLWQALDTRALQMRFDVEGQEKFTEGNREP